MANLCPFPKPQKCEVLFSFFIPHEPPSTPRKWVAGANEESAESLHTPPCAGARRPGRGTLGPTQCPR